jgi:hypothetical protein
MASTSNKNTPGNYSLEHKTNISHGEYMAYVNTGEAHTNHMAGDGLLPGKIARSKLCNNYCDIESQLFGIGTTNLVNPYKSVEPQLRSIQSLSVFQKQSVQIPEPLVIEKNQRPTFMN